MREALEDIDSKACGAIGGPVVDLEDALHGIGIKARAALAPPPAEVAPAAEAPQQVAMPADFARLLADNLPNLYEASAPVAPAASEPVEAWEAAVINAAERMEMRYAARDIPTGALYRGIAEVQWKAAREVFHAALAAALSAARLAGEREGREAMREAVVAIIAGKLAELGGPVVGKIVSSDRVKAAEQGMAASLEWALTVIRALPASAPSDR